MSFIRASPAASPISRRQSLVLIIPPHVTFTFSKISIFVGKDGIIWSVGTIL
jgi:hypothetical protein